MSDIPPNSSPSFRLYTDGNESFVNENYSKSIELYGGALKDVGSSPEFLCSVLCARSHAYIKAEKFSEAKNDADNALEIFQKNNLTPDPKAYLRSGVASFHMGKYSQAKNYFQKGLQIDNDSGLRQWVSWCQEKMEKLGIKEEEEKKTEPSESVVSDTPAPAVPIKKKITQDHYQTDSHLVLEIRIKGLKSDQVQVKFTKTHLSVKAKLPPNNDEENYELEIDLCHPINESESTFRVMSTKIEIKMKKADLGVRWSTLEGVGEDPSSIIQENSSSSSSTSYPTSKAGKDWNKIEVDIKKELEKDKPEGEQALNEMFQKIYADGSDEVRKAMNKSFQESGGTVLSTNWSDIKKEKVEVKPPEGVEFRKWDAKN